MSASRSTLTAAALLLALPGAALFMPACGSSDEETDAGSTTGGGGTTGGDVEPEDSGPPPDPIPPLAPAFGPFTGTFDVNGAGNLFVLEVDGQLALQLTAHPDHYLGRYVAPAADAGRPDAGRVDAGRPVDGGVDAGPPIGGLSFTSRLLYPELETCGALTLNGRFDADAGRWTATQGVCTGTSLGSGTVTGARKLAPNFYKQDLAWSGVFDGTETAATGNGCTRAAGTRSVKVAVSLPRGGGQATVWVLGDGLKDELYFGALGDGGSSLALRARDPIDRPSSTMSLTVDPDAGTLTATREADVRNGASACVAKLTLTGTRRLTSEPPDAGPLPSDAGTTDAGRADAGRPDAGRGDGGP